MTQNLSPLAQSYTNTVKDMAADDPLMPIKATAFETYETVLALLKDSRGVHVETAFGLIGALAGHAAAEIGCARKAALGDRFDPHDIASFAEVQVATGQRYVMGNWINRWFVDDQMSFCRLVMAGAEHFGATDLPDIDAIAINTIQLFGTDAFGTPRLPEDHRPALLPIDLLRRFGPHIVPKLALFDIPSKDIPAALAFTAQTLMSNALDVLDPGLAAHILLECAFPMARTHPDDV